MESAKRLKVAEIVGEATDIAMKVKLLSISVREVQGSKGPFSYHYGLLGDETGVIPFTAWSVPATVREKDVYEISKCYTKSYRDKLRVYFDAHTEFKLLNEPLEVKRVYKFYNLKDLNIKDKFVTVEGVISGEMKKEYEKDGQKKELYNYTLSEGRASIPLTSFGKKLENNKYVRIQGARLDEFNGYYRLNISDKAEVEYISVDLPEESPISFLSDLKVPIGGITVTGFALNLGEKSGLIARCSECNQKIDDIRCSDHPDAPLKYDIFAYFTLDDGTDYIQVSGGFDAFGPICGITQEYLQNKTRPPLKKEVKEKLSKVILHNSLRIKGNLKNSTMGMGLRATEVKLIEKTDLGELAQINGGE